MDAQPASRGGMKIAWVVQVATVLIGDAALAPHGRTGQEMQRNLREYVLPWRVPSIAAIPVPALSDFPPTWRPDAENEQGGEAFQRSRLRR